MHRKMFTVFSLLMVLTIVISAASPAVAAPGNGNSKFLGKYSDGVYIVRMIDDPAVAYDGNIPGYKATKPADGQKINPNDAKVIKYVNR